MMWLVFGEIFFLHPVSVEEKLAVFQVDHNLLTKVSFQFGYLSFSFILQ